MIIKKFQSSQKEAEYQAYLGTEKVRYTRTLSLMAALLYALFIFVDMWSLQSSFAQATIIRSVVISVLFAGFVLTFWNKFTDHYNVLISVIYSVSALGILAVIFISEPNEIAYEDYYAGIILLLFGLFVWTYLNLTFSILLGILSIGSYAAIELLFRNSTGNERIPVLLTNLFFLVSAMTLGFMVQVMRDGYLRQNFLLHKSLHQKAEKSAEEARTQEHLANHDQLTGLPNRRFSEENLDGLMKRARELDLSLVMMYMDLNGFKKINDTYGHDAGDEVLRIAAKRIKSCVRYGDCLARLGGDEFTLGLIVDKHDNMVANEIARKIRTTLEQPIGYDGVKLTISTSIGIASYPADGSTVAELIEISDKRMYEAKLQSKRQAQKSTQSTENKTRQDSRQELAETDESSQKKASLLDSGSKQMVVKEQKKQASVYIFPG